MLYYCFLFDAFTFIVTYTKYMHNILTCLLVDQVASYLSVYDSMQPIHSEAPVAPSGEFLIPVFS